MIPLFFVPPFRLEREAIVNRKRHGGKMPNSFSSWVMVKMMVTTADLAGITSFR
jgi:hypothetical protein